MNFGLGPKIQGQTPGGLPKTDSQKSLQGIENRGRVMSDHKRPEGQVQVKEAPKDVQRNVQVNEQQQVEQKLSTKDYAHLGANYKSFSGLKKFGNFLLQGVSMVGTLGTAKIKYSRTMKGFDVKVQFWGIPRAFGAHLNVSTVLGLRDKMVQQPQQQNPIQPQQMNLSKVTKGGDENPKVRDRAPTNIAPEGGDDHLEIETPRNNSVHQEIVEQSGLSKKLSLKEIAENLFNEIDGSNRTPDGSELDEQEPLPQFDKQKSTEVVSYLSESDKLVQQIQENETPDGSRKKSFLSGLNELRGQDPEKDMNVEDIVLDDIIQQMDSTPGGPDEENIDLNESGDPKPMIKKEPSIQLEHGDPPDTVVTEVLKDIQGMSTQGGNDISEQTEQQIKGDRKLGKQLAKDWDQQYRQTLGSPEKPPKTRTTLISEMQNIFNSKQFLTELDDKSLDDLQAYDSLIKEQGPKLFGVNPNQNIDYAQFVSALGLALSDKLDD